MPAACYFRTPGLCGAGSSVTNTSKPGKGFFVGSIFLFPARLYLRQKKMRQRLPCTSSSWPAWRIGGEQGFRLFGQQAFFLLLLKNAVLVLDGINQGERFRSRPLQILNSWGKECSATGVVSTTPSFSRVCSLVHATWRPCIRRVSFFKTSCSFIVKKSMASCWRNCGSIKARDFP